MGRKKEIMQRSGNLRYLNIVADRTEVYDQVRKAKKKAIAEDVFRTIKKPGERFLRVDETGWVLVLEDAVSW